MGVLAVGALLLDFEVLVEGTELCADGVPHGGYLLRLLDDDGRALAGAADKAVAGEHKLVVVRDHAVDVGIGDADIGGDDVVAVDGVVDEVEEGLDEAHLGLHLYLLLLELGGLSERLRGIGGQVDEGVIAFVDLNLALGQVQLLADDVDTIVDELLGLECYFVLVLVGIVVVGLHELEEVVLGAVDMGVEQGKGGHGGRLAGRSDFQGVGIGTSDDDGRIDDGRQLAVGHLEARVLGEHDLAELGVEQAGEGGEVLLYELWLLAHGRHPHADVDAVVYAGHLDGYGHL